MKVLVVGGGGREHIIIKKLRENKNITKIFALPGNGGIASDAICVNIPAKDIIAVRDFALKEQVDFVVVAPDDPLVLGAVDLLEAEGIPCFGPNKAAAEIEGSKVFSKNLMKKYNIPTAAYEVFEAASDAVQFLEANSKYPIVIKADGLALGKGVIITETKTDALEAVKAIMSDKVFGDSGKKIVIEEYLTGPEVSVLAFTDGKTIVPMVSSMDHKKAQDGDKGLNTGGMGTIAPNPFYTTEIASWCMDNIFMPTIHEMNAEGRSFRGCLYFGLMFTENGPKVIEYNCRFGDPEAQVVLPLLKTDLFDIMLAVSQERLSEITVEFLEGAACCVIVASGGYPTAYKSGLEISLHELPDDVLLLHAGTKLVDDKLQTAGGRVIGVTAVGNNLNEAVKKVYTYVDRVSFEGAFYRRDIGKRAIEKLK